MRLVGAEGRECQGPDAAHSGQSGREEGEEDAFPGQETAGRDRSPGRGRHRSHRSHRSRKSWSDGCRSEGRRHRLGLLGLRVLRVRVIVSADKASADPNQSLKDVAVASSHAVPNMDSAEKGCRRLKL